MFASCNCSLVLREKLSVGFYRESNGVSVVSPLTEAGFDWSFIGSVEEKASCTGSVRRRVVSRSDGTTSLTARGITVGKESVL